MPVDGQRVDRAIAGRRAASSRRCPGRRHRGAPDHADAAALAAGRACPRHGFEVSGWRWSAAAWPIRVPRLAGQQPRRCRTLPRGAFGGGRTRRSRGRLDLGRWACHRRGCTCTARGTGARRWQDQGSWLLPRSVLDSFAFRLGGWRGSGPSCGCRGSPPRPRTVAAARQAQHARRQVTILPPRRLGVRGLYSGVEGARELHLGTAWPRGAVPQASKRTVAHCSATRSTMPAQTCARVGGRHVKPARAGASPEWPQGKASSKRPHKVSSKVRSKVASSQRRASAGQRNASSKASNKAQPAATRPATAQQGQHAGPSRAIRRSRAVVGPDPSGLRRNVASDRRAVDKRSNRLRRCGDIAAHRAAAPRTRTHA